MAKEVTIPIEDGAIPDGWEPERFGFPNEGEMIIALTAWGGGQPVRVQPQENFSGPRMIVRKKYDPGIDCIPKGWWVWSHQGNWIASQTPNEDKGPNNFWLTGLQHSVGFVAPADEPRKIT